MLQYERFEILSEGGLRTAVVNLLNRKIQSLGKSAVDYRVVCELYLKHSKVKPDILIWRGKHPRIWIELKDTNRYDSGNATKDWEKLERHIEKYKTIKNWYLIYVSRCGKGDLKNPRNRDTMRSWLIKIAVKPFISNFDEWNEEYKRRAHYELPK
jgi:hypothetical protein